MILGGVLRDSVLSSLLQTTRLLGGLLLLPILIGALGPQSYGWVALGISICTYTSLIESAVTPVLRNRLNIEKANENRDALNTLEQVAVTAGVFLLFFATILTMSFLGIHCLWNKFNDSIVAMAIICVIAINLGAVGGIVDCLFSTQDRLWVLRVYELIGTLVGFLGAVTAAKYGKAPADTIVLACLVVAPHSLKPIAWGWDVARQRFRCRINFLILKNFLVDHRRDSLNFIYLQGVMSLLSTFPTIYVSSTFGLASTTLLSTIQRVMTAPATLAISLMPVIWPRITRAHAKGHAKTLQRIFFAGLFVFGFYIFGWVSTVFLWKNEIFDLLGGKTLGAVPDSFIIIMGFFVMISLFGAWISTFLNAMNEFLGQLKFSMMTLVVAVVMGIGFGEMWALSGVMLGISVATAVFSILPTAFLVLRHLRR